MPNKNDFKKTENVIADGLKSVENITSDAIVSPVNDKVPNISELEQQNLHQAEEGLEADIELLNEELENKKLKDPEKKELEKELEKDKTDLEKVKEKEKELGLKKKNDNDNDSDPEEEFIEEIERITTIVNYSYLNCFAYLLEGYTTENIKKFYDEFKAWGARSIYDFQIIAACEAYFIEINKRLNKK